MKYLLISCLILSSGAANFKTRPTLFLVGDSTVKNGSGKGQGGLWGWGDLLYEQVDTMKIRIENSARGGRSSRTFQAEGLWEKVVTKIKPGDFVIIQFGHNDEGPVNDTIRARGSIRGIGNETEEIDNLITKKHEIVHTYGWYLRKYIQDTKSKGGTPIVCSLVARNIWKDGKVIRATESYSKWSSQIAREEGVTYIDLNDAVAKRYEELGEKEVTSKLFLQDHTHTNLEGAKVNAGIVADEIRRLKKISLRKYL